MVEPTLRAWEMSDASSEASMVPGQAWAMANMCNAQFSEAAKEDRCEFIHMGCAATPAERKAAVKRFAQSRQFTRLMRTASSPHELSNRAQWVLRAMQTVHQ